MSLSVHSWSQEVKITDIVNGWAYDPDRDVIDTTGTNIESYGVRIKVSRGYNYTIKVKGQISAPPYIFIKRVDTSGNIVENISYTSNYDSSSNTTTYSYSIPNTGSRTTYVVFSIYLAGEGAGGYADPRDVFAAMSPRYYQNYGPPSRWYDQYTAINPYRYNAQTGQWYEASQYRIKKYTNGAWS